MKIGEGDYSEGLSIEFITQQDLLQVDFRNVYKSYPIDVVLEAEKILTGGTLEADQFDFILESEEGLFEPVTAKNDGNGNISFAPLSFDEDTVGVHGFVISEVKGNDPKITYSDEKIYVQVDIQKDDEGYLHSQVQYSRDKGQWQQEKMSITNVQVTPTEETLQVKKSITGRTFKEGDSFTFVLKDENNRMLTVLQSIHLREAMYRIF